MYVCVCEHVRCSALVALYLEGRGEGGEADRSFQQPMLWLGCCSITRYTPGPLFCRSTLSWKYLIKRIHRRDPGELFVKFRAAVLRGAAVVLFLFCPSRYVFFNFFHRQDLAKASTVGNALLMGNFTARARELLTCKGCIGVYWSETWVAAD